MKRRDFFKIVTATGAAAAAGGCQQATETILPLVVPNEQLVPGVAAWFATVCRECPAGCGVLARNREGRVVKLEGNPDHPVNRGGLCIRGQAALQGLYHPDRVSGPQRRNGAIFTSLGWDEALKAVGERLAAARGAGKGRGVALVTQLETGSLGALMDRWTEALGARPRVTLEPFGHEAIRAASRAVFGRDAVPSYAFEDARVILNFGADWVETWINNVAFPTAVALLNAATGNVGKTMRFGPDWAYGKATPYAEVAKLVQAMAAGEIEVLLLGPGVNPAFTLPGGLKAADAIKKVPFVVSFGNLPDETTTLAHLILPDTHWLETWGDYAPREGVTGLMQPAMKPIRDARPIGDVLLTVGRTVLGAEEGKGPLPWAGFEAYLRAAWEPLVKGDLAGAQRRGGVWRDVASAAIVGRPAPVEATAAELEGDAGGYALLA